MSPYFSKKSEKKIPKKLECIRCGVCCIVAPCAELDETGICSQLTIHKEGYTSCKYIEKEGLIFSGGCAMRHSEEVYKYYKEQAEKKVGIKLVGITTTTKGGMKQCVREHTS